MLKERDEAVQGQDPSKQKEIDAAMIKLDGTENKGKLGANAILAVSMAVSKVRCFSTCPSTPCVNARKLREVCERVLTLARTLLKQYGVV